MSGIADAIALSDDGRPMLVVDWKSDVDPSEGTIAHYRSQVAQYLAACRIDQALIVFATGAKVERVARRG